MRVARYYTNKDIRLEEMPVPVIGPGEILVKVRKSGICGTDVMEWYRVRKGPRILGHEIAGDIVTSMAERYAPGQRVFVSHHVPCGACRYCAAGNHTACATLHQGNYDPGGYSEYIRVPKINVDHGVYVLPEPVSYEEGTMIEPLACALRAMRVINVCAGETVLILGAGISGILNIQAARLRGARVIVTDLDPGRLERALQFGAHQALSAAGPLDVKAEKVILCTGAYPAVETAFRCVDRKGTILLFAIPDRDITIPLPDAWRHEVTVTSSYGAAPADLEEALKLIADGKINVRDTVTHRFPLVDIQEAFRVVVAGGQALKVVLEP